MSLRTTVSSIGMDWSAAVAARSAGCSYAFGEISRSRWSSGRGSVMWSRYSTRPVAAGARAVAAVARPVVGRADELHRRHAGRGRVPRSDAVVLPGPQGPEQHEHHHDHDQPE